MEPESTNGEGNVYNSDLAAEVKEWENWSRTANAHLTGAIAVAYRHGATEDEVVAAMLAESDKLMDTEEKTT